MEQKYADWIKAKNITQQSAYGACAEMTLEMNKAFPELIRVRGWYEDPIWDDREHWWLKTPTGEIVDPTAIQFPTKGHSTYREFVEGVDKEPTGKCPECGEWCFDGADLCSKECERSYLAYLNGGPL